MKTDDVNSFHAGLIMVFTTRRAAAALWVGMVVSSTAAASSDAAWRTFRADVGRACRAAAASQFVVDKTTVDPFGSAQYGLARLVGHEPNSHVPSQLLCAYNKRTHRAEVGTPMTLTTPRAQ